MTDLTKGLNELLTPLEVEERIAEITRNLDFETIQRAERGEITDTDRAKHPKLETLCAAVERLSSLTGSDYKRYSARAYRA